MVKKSNLLRKVPKLGKNKCSVMVAVVIVLILVGVYFLLKNNGFLGNREGFEGTTRLKYTIISVDGNYDTKTVREFIDKSLLARDARALRLHIKEISPDTELKVDLTYSDGYIEYNVPFPLGVNFFWPDVGV